MKLCDQQALMDEMEIFIHHTGHFLCSAEQLPTGISHAVVRYRHPPGDGIQTQMVDQEMHQTIAHRAFIDQRFFEFFDKHHEVPAIYPRGWLECDLI